LQGGQGYLGTFVRFARRHDGQIPAALVELDDCVDVTEGQGLRHHGRYAVLRLAYIAAWDETETVMVHIVEKFPEDVALFCDTHPFGTELEARASYRIVSDDA